MAAVHGSCRGITRGGQWQHLFMHPWIDSKGLAVCRRLRQGIELIVAAALLVGGYTPLCVRNGTLPCWLAGWLQSETEKRAATVNVFLNRLLGMACRDQALTFK